MPSALRAALVAVSLLLCTPAVLAATWFSSDASDLWWNPDESGWGINVVQQGNVIFATLYVYGADGKAHWYVAPDTEGSAAATSGRPMVFAGPLYETTGPVFSTSFNPNLVGTRQVGNLTFEYGVPNSGLLTYSVDGTTVTKALRRQTWRSATLAPEYEVWRSLRSSNCTRAGSETEQFIVTQSGPAVTIQMRSGTSLVCTFAGTLQQTGRLATLAGTATCAGAAAPFIFNDMEIGVHGFMAHYEGTEQGCFVYGNVSGSDPNVPQASQ